MNPTEAINGAENSLYQKKSKNKELDNEVKIKFMNAKSKNINFTNGGEFLPFPLPEKDNEENILGELDTCPSKTCNFFNEFNESNQANHFNSFLFLQK